MGLSKLSVQIMILFVVNGHNSNPWLGKHGEQLLPDLFSFCTVEGLHERPSQHQPYCFKLE